MRKWGAEAWKVSVLTGCPLIKQVLKKERFSQHAVDINMSALAKLTFYEYLVSALTGFRIKRVKFRENVKGFSRDKEKCLD